MIINLTYRKTQVYFTIGNMYFYGKFVDHIFYIFFYSCKEKFPSRRIPLKQIDIVYTKNICLLEEEINILKSYNITIYSFNL